MLSNIIMLIMILNGECGLGIKLKRQILPPPLKDEMVGWHP